MQVLDIWKFCLELCFQNIWFILAKKLATFGYVDAIFIPRKSKLISKNYEIDQPTKVKRFRFPTSRSRDGVGGVALESEG